MNFYWTGRTTLCQTTARHLLTKELRRLSMLPMLELPSISDLTSDVSLGIGDTVIVSGWDLSMFFISMSCIHRSGGLMSFGPGLPLLAGWYPFLK